jgi:hypothetical protein
MRRASHERFFARAPAALSARHACPSLARLCPFAPRMTGEGVPAQRTQLLRELPRLLDISLRNATRATEPARVSCSTGDLPRGPLADQKQDVKLPLPRCGARAVPSGVHLLRKKPTSWKERFFRLVPALDSLRHYSARDARHDVLAGITVASVAVPKAPCSRRCLFVLAPVPFRFSLGTRCDELYTAHDRHGILAESMIRGYVPTSTCVRRLAGPHVTRRTKT